MQFTTSALAAILAFTSTAAAVPQDLAAKGLKDWQVTDVNVFTPSGRPGSYPWAYITANVTDPNQINLGPSKTDNTQVIVPAGSQGLNCQAKWFTKGENPLGRTWPCDPVENGYWTVVVLAGSTGSFSSTDFKLRFTHVADVLYQGTEYTASYQSEGAFKLGDNLSGVCGGSGVCSWGLKEDKKPFPIKPKKI